MEKGTPGEHVDGFAVEGPLPQARRPVAATYHNQITPLTLKPQAALQGEKQYRPNCRYDPFQDLIAQEGRLAQGRPSPCRKLAAGSTSSSSGPHFLFQEVLLQLVQQSVGFPHAGFLDEGRVAQFIECLPPYGFAFLPEFPPDGFDLLLELPPPSFDFAFELPGPHCAPPKVQFGMRSHHETINGVFWT
jgi:hypothetical protein